MAKQIEDLRHCLSGENERIVLRAALAYRRMLDDFARILTSCRRREGATIQAISERTAVPPWRLEGFEKGALAASWSEMLLLAPVYGVRLSCITRRLKSTLAKISGDDRSSIEAYLQCHCGMTPTFGQGDRERINEKLKEPLNERFINVTIAEWPSCFPPSLSTLIGAEVEIILGQLREINACIAGIRADDPERHTTLSGIHRSLVGIATSLGWQARRHYSSECIERLPRRREETVQEKTIRFVTHGIAECRTTVLQAASRLEPFAGSERRQCDSKSASEVKLRQALFGVYAPCCDLLEDALSSAVLRLAGAATRLIALEKQLS